MQDIFCELVFNNVFAIFSVIYRTSASYLYRLQSYRSIGFDTADIFSLVSAQPTNRRRRHDGERCS